MYANDVKLQAYLIVLNEASYDAMQNDVDEIVN